VASTMLVPYLVGVVAVLFIGPMVLFCLRPDVLRAEFTGGAEALGALAPSSARQLIADLGQMGFEALGVKTEKTPLRPAVRELSFVAHDRRCYASIGLGSLGPRLYYFTPLPEAGFVLTSNGAFPAIRTESVAQRSYRGCGAQELLGHHSRTLAELGRRGEVVPTPEGRIEATYAYYRTPEVRRVLRRTGVVLLVWVGVIGWVLFR
jgi:hypothetical protein